MSSLVQLASVSMSSSCTLTFRSPRCLQTQDSSTCGNSSFSLRELQVRLMKVRKKPHTHTKKTKKMKSTLNRKLNPIIRYEGGRKFFFPKKIMYIDVLKIGFLRFILTRYLTSMVTFVLLFLSWRNISYIQNSALCKKQEWRKKKYDCLLSSFGLVSPWIIHFYKKGGAILSYPYTFQLCKSTFSSIKIHVEMTWQMLNLSWQIRQNFPYFLTDFIYEWT